MLWWMSGLSDESKDKLSMKDKANGRKSYERDKSSNVEIKKESKSEDRVANSCDGFRGDEERVES